MRSSRQPGLFGITVVLGVFLALAMVSGVVVSTSYAAFSDTASSSGNTFSTGTVDLVDDDLGAVRFNVSGLIPGQSVTGCVTVTYQGTVADPGPVRVYSGGFSDSGSLASHLDLTIEEGTGGSFAECAGFTATGTIESGTLASFHAARTTYATGAGVWNPSSTPVSRSYRITVTLSASTPNTQQAASVTAQTFVWEVQS